MLQILLLAAVVRHVEIWDEAILVEDAINHESSGKIGATSITVWSSGNFINNLIAASNLCIGCLFLPSKKLYQNKFFSYIKISSFWVFWTIRAVLIEAVPDFYIFCSEGDCHGVRVMIFNE